MTRAWIRHSGYFLLILCYVAIGASGTPLDWGPFAGKDQRIAKASKSKSSGPGGCKTAWTQYKHVMTSVRIDASPGCVTGDAYVPREKVEFIPHAPPRLICLDSPLLRRHNPRSPPVLPGVPL